MPASVQQVVSSPGNQLDVTTRSLMESRLGCDFAGVRVHSNGGAAESALAVGAAAYTVGQHVVFGAGQYSPHTPSGRGLLAHELAHVVQQSGASPSSDLVIRGSRGPAEAEARQTAQSVTSGAEASPVRTRVPRSIQRAPLSADADPIHKPLIDDFRKKHGLPPGGVDPSGNRVGPSDAEIKYGEPAEAAALAQEMRTLIDNAVWKEIRKRVYPAESAAGIRRAKERHAGRQPDLTGLGRLAALDHFATEIKGLQSRWTTLPLPDDRVAALRVSLNAELTSANVPGFILVEKEPMEWKGYFEKGRWRFAVSQDLVSGATLPDKDAGELANVALHEGRHAEQEFLAARFSAGVNNKDSAFIQTDQGIPQPIADEAVTKKFTSGTDATTKDLGKKMYKAKVTDRAVNQQISSDDGPREMGVARGEAEVAVRDLDAVPVTVNITKAKAKRDALKGWILEVERRYTLYRAIPYEADAHEVGDAAEQAFLGWPP
jgi:hypothetical protein